MGKTILERLLEKSSENYSSEAKRNISIFLALRTEINDAIQKGWPVKDIWQLLFDEKKISVSYQVFLRLVKKHTNYQEIKRTRKTNNHINQNSLSESNKDSKSLKEWNDSSESNGGDFKWSNEYKKDDLV